MNVQSLLEFLGSQRRRVVLGVFFVFVAAILTKGVAFISLRNIESRWPAAEKDRTSEVVGAITAKFQAYQNTTHRFAKKLVHNDQLSVWIASGLQDDRIALFEHLQYINSGDRYSVEVFDANDSLIAWDGRTVEGLAQHIVRPGSSASDSYSVVIPGAIYSYLTVVVPIFVSQQSIGSVAVSRALEVNYPLNNRFLQRTGVAGELSAELGLPIQFELSGAPLQAEDGEVVRTALKGIDGRVLGFATFQRIGRTAHLQTLEQQYGRLVNLLLAVGFLGVLLVAYLFLRRRLPYAWWLVVLSVLLWGVRYFWLWVGFPSELLEWQIFEPKLFASPFGGGLAGSMGEFLITSLFLVLSAGALLRAAWGASRQAHSAPRGGLTALTALLAVPAISTLVFFIVRAYAASVQSAVFDSTLSYFDPTTVLPDLAVGTMLVILFLMTASLFLISLSAFLVSLRVANDRVSQNVHPAYLVVATFGLVAVVFHSLHPNPLLSIALYLFFTAMVGTIGVFFWNLGANVPARAGIQHLTFLGLASLLFVTPVLDHFVHAREREQVQALAEEMTRPADTWLSFVIEQTLKQVASDGDILQILAGAHPERAAKLAFTAWSRSLLSSEGYDCSIAIFAPDGTLQSEFSIGSHEESRAAEPSFTTENEPAVSVREGKSVMGKYKKYSGSEPMRDVNGTLLGYVAATLYSGQRSFFRGETPEVLRSYSMERLETSVRPIAVSEFAGNRLTYTTGENFPVGRRVPPEVLERHQESPGRYAWVDETVEGNQYQTLYVFGTDGDVSLALAMGRLDLRWHLFSWSKAAFFFVILGLLLWTAVVGVRSIFGYRYRVTFGHKVLAGLLFVALIPIVLLALYNRQLVLDRIEDFTTQRLRSELGLVNLRLQENLEQGVQQFLSETNDEYCRRIANEVGTDFNIYMEGRLLASSRPELFEADLLDTQTSSASYVNILLKRKNFFRETESVGRYPYVVGCRPIVGPDERIAGMIAVPTLYRQSEIDEELAKRNAFIFGVYALVVVFVVTGGAVFALRIARPVRSLTLATKRIAEGDLGIEIPSGRRDEIGDLVDSFNAMSRDLKKSREELARVERELAWREMAKQVAHEIKNPLTPMKLSVQHLRQAYKDRARNWKQIFESVTRTLLDQIDTLSHIASEFSRVARMPAAGGTACDINKVVQEAVALFSQEEGIEFRTEYDEAVPSIVADPEELRRAFINIIRNGIQAIRLKSGTRGRITLKTRRMDGTASVRFEDDGCGIPEEVKAKLFQPYFSTKTDGMGLGLVLVHRTVDQLGGTVTVESAVGRGTTIEVSLPLPRRPAKKMNR